MSTPSLLVLTLEAKVREMRAYIAEAFTPKQVEAVLGEAIEHAMEKVPAHITSEVNTAIHDICADQVKNAMFGLRLNERVRNAVRVTVLRELGRAMIEAAEEAEAAQVK